MAPALRNVLDNIAQAKKITANHQIAILKILPKIENPITVDDYRPISLLIKDLSFLSHFLAQGFFKNLKEVKGQHEQVFLNYRYTNT